MSMPSAPRRRLVPILMLLACAALLTQLAGDTHSPADRACALATRATSTSASPRVSFSPRPVGADRDGATPDSSAQDIAPLAGTMAPLRADPIALAKQSSQEKQAAKAAKKIAKLEKKVLKKQKHVVAREEKIAQAQAAMAELQGKLALAQQALLDAQAMPQDTPEQVKARSKAIKAALKAIAKLEKAIAHFGKRIDKLQMGIDKLADSIDQLNGKIDVLAQDLPGTLPDMGDEGLDGLLLPERLDMMATSAGGGGGAAFLGGTNPVDSFPPEADYFADEAHAFVYDRATESIDMVNSILCQLRQTAYDQLVNVGPYNAQIDPALCDAGGPAETGNGGQPSDESQPVELWVVDSRRTTAGADHFVGMWVPNPSSKGDPGGGPGGNPGGGPGGGPGAEPDSVIHILAHIEAPESTDNPFGLFDLDFAALSVEDSSDVLFHGTLATLPAAGGQVGFQFFEEGGDPSDPNAFSEHTQVSVEMAVDGSGGVAHVREMFNDPGDPNGPGGTFVQEFLLAFDDAHLLRIEDSQPAQCLARLVFDTNVWRYNLYHADGPEAGQRVALNSGFGFQTASGEFGWAGYFGVWTPDGTTLQTGDVVLRNSYGPDAASPDPFTFWAAPGKLIRSERSEVLLSQLDGELFEWWDASDPNLPPTVQQLEYVAATGDFVRRTEMVDGQFEDLPPAQQTAVDRVTHPWLSMWSSSLGGTVDHLDGDDFVAFFEERVVDANDPLLAGGELTLYGYIGMLDTDLTGAQALAGDVYAPDAMDVGSPYVYQFRANDMGLHLDTFSDGSSFSLVGLSPGETYTGGPFAQGMRSGPLVTDLTGLTDVFDVFHADVFYTYETGPNPWNVYSTLRDVNDVPVSFDPPLQFTYVHSLPNDRNGDPSFTGKTYQLEYNGPGDLFGIPFDGVDIDGDGMEDRWYPRFSLADGVVLGPTGSEYVVKAIDMEQTLSVDPAGCDTLSTDAAAALLLPDGSSYRFPAIGDMPLVTDPPLVIAGEVQTGGS